jgi:hypothetical protein
VSFACALGTSNSVLKTALVTATNISLLILISPAPRANSQSLAVILRYILGDRPFAVWRCSTLISGHNDPRQAHGVYKASNFDHPEADVDHRRLPVERCRSTRGELCRLFILGAAAARSILACCFGFGRTPRRTAEFTDMLHSLT